LTEEAQYRIKLNIYAFSKIKKQDKENYRKNNN
jgi:hypothetical protein